MMTDAQIRSDPAPIPSVSLDGAGAAIVLSSIVTSALAYGTLPGSMRIRWTFGGPHYGPEFAPTWLVLAAFPLLVAACYAGARWLATRLEELEASDPARSLYDAVALLTLLALVCVQVAIVVANAGVL